MARPTASWTTSSGTNGPRPKLNWTELGPTQGNRNWNERCELAENINHANGPNTFSLALGNYCPENAATMGDCSHKKVPDWIYIFISIHTVDSAWSTEKREEEKENNLWGVRPSGQEFSTWPHRKLANEISPRKAIYIYVCTYIDIGLQIFNRSAA